MIPTHANDAEIRLNPQLSQSGMRPLKPTEFQAELCPRYRWVASNLLSLTATRVAQKEAGSHLSDSTDFTRSGTQSATRH